MDKFIVQLGESKMMLVFIVVIGAIAGYLSYSGSDAPIIPDNLNSSQKRSSSLESFADLNINFSILDNETYKALEIFGENPVDPGITGERIDPFAPI
ncbi:MAG: hypothetical protein Q8Q89_00030 [bacterium]|nr:hypothetical protein [bacterium]